MEAGTRGVIGAPRVALRPPSDTRRPAAYVLVTLGNGPIFRPMTGGVLEAVPNSSEGAIGR